MAKKFSNLNVTRISLWVFVALSLVLLLLWNTSNLVAQMMGGRMSGGMMRRAGGIRQYSSNGERIFHTGMNQSGERLIYSLEMMGSNQPVPAVMTCATCHGERGQGRVMMMATPNISYQNLSNPHGMPHPDGERRHPPYNEELLKVAITKGIDPVASNYIP